MNAEDKVGEFRRRESVDGRGDDDKEEDGDRRENSDKRLDNDIWCVKNLFVRLGESFQCFSLFIKVKKLSCELMFLLYAFFFSLGIYVNSGLSFSPWAFGFYVRYLVYKVLGSKCLFPNKFLEQRH